MASISWATLMAAACASTDQNDPQESPHIVEKAGKTVSDAVRAVKIESKNAARVIENKLDVAGREIEETREELLASSRKKAEKLQREFDELEDGIEEHDLQMSSNAQNARRQLARNLEELEKTTDTNWNEVKQGSRSGIAEVTTDIQPKLREARQEIAVDGD